MAEQRRIKRINSLLKETISDVIRMDLKHYKLPELITITEVDTSRDLQHAKVYVSLVNGSADDKSFLVEELQKCASKIAYMSSKKVVMRYFPQLTFKIDNSIDEYMKIDALLTKAGVNQDNEIIIEESLEIDEEVEYEDDDEESQDSV